MTNLFENLIYVLLENEANLLNAFSDTLCHGAHSVNVSLNTACDILQSHYLRPSFLNSHLLMPLPWKWQYIKEKENYDNSTHRESWVKHLLFVFLLFIQRLIIFLLDQSKLWGQHLLQRPYVCVCVCVSLINAGGMQLLMYGVYTELMMGVWCGGMDSLQTTQQTLYC